MSECDWALCQTDPIEARHQATATTEQKAMLQQLDTKAGLTSVLLAMVMTKYHCLSEVIILREDIYASTLRA